MENCPESIVTQRMLALRDEEQAKVLSRFFKTGNGEYGEGDFFLGVKVPQTRQVVKELWQTCSLIDIRNLLMSGYHEIRLCGLLILVQKYRHARKDEQQRQDIVDFYLKNTWGINNWDLVDLSCYEILGDWCLSHDRDVLYRLAHNGKTIWEQRIGIVSTMALVRTGQYDDTLAIADILLQHEHDLIQKAVGWLLREVGKHDMNTLKEFLSTRYQTMPRTMLRYAIEKFPEEERQAYLKGTV